MHVARVLADLPICWRRHGGEFGFSPSGCKVDLAILGSFFVGLFAPTACDDDVGFFATRQIERNDGVFTDAATYWREEGRVMLVLLDENSRNGRVLPPLTL